MALTLIAVVPSTENMPSGTAVKPGDLANMRMPKRRSCHNCSSQM